MALEDPDGLVINKELNEITDTAYVDSEDLNDDGDLDDLIVISDLKLGYYKITVIPEPDAEPTDTYTLTVSTGGTTIVLAEDVPIRDIPDQPYIIKYLKGDLNSDGILTPADAAIALQLAVSGAHDDAADISGTAWSPPSTHS